MSTAAPTSFAVAICTHQRWNDVSRCLAALSPQARALGFSILVIDSGSSPTAAGHLIELSKQYSAEYLRVDEPGLSRARNVALEYSSEEWIAFLDDDAEPHAEWASSLTELLSKASEQIAALQPDLLFLDIEMPTGTGFDVIQCTKDFGYETIFVFFN